jgi:cytoskeletal protein CcmA (bactofilin family)
MIKENMYEIVEDENKIDTVFGDDIDFRGTLKFSGSLKIKGYFEGKIISNGHLIIGEDAVVKANIVSDIVTINGKIYGNIETKKFLEITSTGRLYGDIKTPLLSIEKGSKFTGNSYMGEEE